MPVELVEWFDTSVEVSRQLSSAAERLADVAQKAHELSLAN